MAHVNYIHNIPFISIFLTMFGGIITPLFSNGKIAQKINLIIVCIVGVLSTILLGSVWQNKESFTFMMGHFPAPWGNELTAGPLEALLALTFSFVMATTLLGGAKFIQNDILAEKQNLYFVMINLLFGSMLALIYTNDIFTAYVFLEINTIASCAIIMAKGTGESIAATLHYLIICLLGSGLFLIGISLLYSITGHLLMPNIQQSIIQLTRTGEYAFPFAVVIGMIIIGISIKSAVFPFHFMLASAHPAATPASSSILSGLVLKSFIFLNIKMFYCVFTIDLIRNLRITNVLFLFGLIGMVVGSVSALKETRIKHMLAYSSAAQIGYIYMGLGLGNHAGMVAACFHILAHAATKAMLFICAGGLMSVSEGKDGIHDLRGAAHKNLMAGIGFTVGGLSMVGVPLTAGFVSKLYFASATIYSPQKMVITLLTLAISMILNAMYFIPSAIAIWTPVEKKTERPKVSRRMEIGIAIFIVTNFCLGIFYKPIIDMIELGIGLL